MVLNLNKIIIFGTIFFTILGTATEAKEEICGNLSTYVYMQNANPPKIGCLYSYNPYDRMNPLTLRVQQVINGGILVSADTVYYRNYFSNPKTIFIQTSKQFVDDQLMRDKEIVKYMGVYDYVTVLGARKRVYKFYRYGKYEIEKNVEKSDLEAYGFIKQTANQQKVNNNEKNEKQISTTETDEYFKVLKSAEKEFVDTTDQNPSKCNDLKFRKFLFTYWNTIENINEIANDGIKQLSFEDANRTEDFNKWNPRAQKLAKYYENNGIAVIYNGEGYFVATVKTDYLTSFYKYLTPEYKNWLNFEKQIKTEVGIQDNCHRKLYEIVKEGKDYYND